MRQDFTSATTWPGSFGEASAVGETDLLRVEGRFPSSWAQGRAVFGGAVAGVCLRAGRALVSPEHALLSVDTLFFAPVQPEAPVALEARVVRRGKSVTNLDVTLAQQGRVCARVTPIYGVARPSRIAVAQAPRKLPPLEGTPLPHIEGVTPTFIQHFELTWAIGSYPFTGASEAVLGGWCKHRGDDEGEAALVALIDAWPVPVLPLLSAPAPASSVRWTAYLVDAARYDGKQPCFYEARVLAARDGHASALAHLYDAQGELIAWSDQLVAYF